MLKVVVLGGGTGCPVILEGLKPREVSLTAVVTMMDSGGSSGRIREELNLPAVGDFRRCLQAMAGSNRWAELMARLSDYRFESSGELAGHSLGNLILSGLIKLDGSINSGLDSALELFGVAGTVLPVTTENSTVCAILSDGSTLISEGAIDRRGISDIKIEKVYLDPQVHADPRVIETIQNCNAVVFAPGDLFTSLIPILLVDGVSQAIASSSARLIVVANLHTKNSETGGYKLSDFLSTLVQYLAGDTIFDSVIVNNEPINMFGDNQIVELDLDASNKWTHEINLRPVASLENLGSHDPERTANAILEVLNS